MKTTLKTGTIYLTLASFVFVGTGYIINIFLGRFLGPSLYGVYGIIISLITAINLTQTAGLPQAVSKYIAEDETKADMVLKSGLIIQVWSTLLVSVIFFLLAEPIAKLLKDISLVPYLQISAFVFPLYGIYSLYLNFYNGLHYFKKQALLGIIYALIKLLSVLVLAYIFHIYGVIIGFIIAPLLAMLYGLHIPSKKLNGFPIKKIVIFSLPLIGVAIFLNLLQSIDLFFVKALLHVNKLTGFYTANQNIAEIPFYGVISFASVLFPSISRHVSHNLIDEVKNIISKSLRFAVLIIIPSILMLSATSLQVIRLLYSSAYISGTGALSILTIGDGFFTLFVILATIISGAGSPWKSSLLAGAGVIMSCLLCLVLIPRFGISGAALATTVASFVVMVGAGVIVYRKFGVLFNFKSSCKIFSASLIIYTIAKLIVLPVILLPFFYVMLFGIYIVLLFLLKEITKEDMTLVRSLFSGKMK